MEWSVKMDKMLAFNNLPFQKTSKGLLCSKFEERSLSSDLWMKVFKNGPSEILFGPFLNTMTHIFG